MPAGARPRRPLLATVRPSDFAVQFRVIGVRSREKVRAIAYQVREVMRDRRRRRRSASLLERACRRACGLVIDQDRARLLGVDASGCLQSACVWSISGVTVTTLRDGIDQIDVVARAVPAGTR